MRATGASRYCVRCLIASVRHAQDAFVPHAEEVVDMLCACMRIKEDSLDEEDISADGKDDGDAETLRAVAEYGLHLLLNAKLPWAPALRQRLFQSGHEDVGRIRTRIPLPHRAPSRRPPPLGSLRHCV